MSFREEENQRNCPSRGLGLAAAAIGVGVGAALYYFFSKRPEHPAPSGSTSGGWHYESDRAFLEESSDSYQTTSEYTTTDTSIYEDDDFTCNMNEESESESDSDPNYVISDTSFQSSSTYSESSIDSSTDDEVFNVRNDIEIAVSSETSVGWDSEGDWHVTDITTDVPSFTPTFTNPINSFITSIFTPRRRNSRERSRTEEQCSICFDTILPSQECISLPCTHFFHQTCILPWLEQQQTCPNCRKNID